jgi:endo-alpha-1,4-polygalactosaminidase (GH114 family)
VNLVKKGWAIPAAAQRIIAGAMLFLGIAACQGPSADVSCCSPSETSGQDGSGFSIPSASASGANPDDLVPGSSLWQWQLTDLPVDRSIEADFYDIDLFENEARTVADLQAADRKVVCYISAGSWEDWRPDADEFPEAVLGKDYLGWPGEKWLDIRRVDLLGPIMEARLDECQAKGFDGVEPDNLDGYTNRTGFPLTYQDQLAYNIWFADQAHARGLSIGLKNDGDQAADLVAYFDWALVEDCFVEGWCENLEVFRSSGKPVFGAEYTDHLTVTEFITQICPQAAQLEYNVILKNRDLDAWRDTCP